MNTVNFSISIYFSLNVKYFTNNLTSGEITKYQSLFFRRPFSPAQTKVSLLDILFYLSDI